MKDMAERRVCVKGVAVESSEELYARMYSGMARLRPVCSCDTEQKGIRESIECQRVFTWVVRVVSKRSGSQRLGIKSRAGRSRIEMLASLLRMLT